MPILKNIKTLSLVISLLVLLLILQQSTPKRWVGYETIPSPVLDEFNYIWQGLSLKSNGIPVAWTTFTGLFKDPKSQTIETTLDGLSITKNNTTLNVWEFKKDPRPLSAVKQIDWGDGIKHLFFVAPFFDHAPLGGLILSTALDQKVKEFSEVKPAMFRQSSIILAIVTSVLLYILVFLVSRNPWIAVLASLIYSSVPTYILATRTAFLENVVSPFIMSHLIFLVLSIYWLKKAHFVNSFLFISGLLGGLAVLSKEPALGFVAGSLILLLLEKRSRINVLLFIIGAIIPPLVYIAWGLWLQSWIFLNMLLANSSRETYGSLKLISMLTSLRFPGFFEDGWWTWGFLSLIFLITNLEKKYLALLIPFGFHFLLFIFLGSLNYPWYYISMIPFLAAFSAMTLWQLYQKPNFILAASFFLIPLSSTFYWGYSVFHQPISVTPYRLIALVFALVIFCRLKFKNNQLVNILWTIFFILLVYQLTKWNFQSVLFIISNWGKLPMLSLPNL